MVGAGPQQEVLTYEDYMAEDPIMRRYDIIDGVRIFMTNPSMRHQDILLSVAEKLRAFQRSTRLGKVMVAPFDVLITREPFRTRQPDVLFISFDRLGPRVPTDPTPLSPAPELAIEILSPSNTPRMLRAKILDYCSVGVDECWLIGPDKETVEVLRLTASGPEVVATCEFDQTVQSIALPELRIKVSDIFEIENQP